MAHSASATQPRDMDTAAFLQHIEAAFARIFSDGLNLMEYLPEDKWLALKEAGLLLPFLDERHGGRKASQFEIQEVLRIAGHYGVPVTLRTGIEGALVLQPLQEFGNDAQIAQGLDWIFNGEGGGLAVTEPETSGAAIAREMQSYYEYTAEDTVYVRAAKYWQGNSQSDFLLVAAKERKNGKLSKTINLLLVPKQYITYEALRSEGLRAVRYAVNRIDTEMPASAVMKLSDSDAAGLRAFQNIFIRSRLQLVGMTHGIMEYIVANTEKFSRSDIKFVEYERSEIARRYQVSQVLYDFTCRHVSPEAPVAHQLMEANIIKTLATEYTYEAAQMLQKLLGAKGFERGHPASNIAIDFRPFTIFEGPNDMLYAEIYDQFTRATAAEKEAGVKLDKNQTLLARLQSDIRFSAVALPERTLPQDVADFLAQHTLGCTCALKKVFAGKIIARLFVYVQAQSDEAARFVLKGIRKDILDCAYCG
ncbi:acyl-CoA dehydrogenase family protein [Bergeriella denitrificans]|uniref:Oxidoreductase n=1 Tax=Bergeriella denitrificans TaxID=494 RepID=A0A378UGT2_BERDE|nr:acyl-CoA dehydrogenase family protein [Bergeriella denitrificans]STZ75672.1 oxidoreductase [Bergeriella denitrificans]